MLTDYHENWIVINGRTGVEFFFIVSGCLMCASASKGTASDICTDTFRFMWKKVCRLMPNFIIAYLIAFLVYHYNARITDPAVIANNLVKSLPEFLLIKNSGIRFPSYNGPTWYLSAMLLNMLVLYPLLRKWKDTFYVIALPVLLLILGYFFQEFGTLSDLESWNGWILKGTLRGTAGLLAGCLCYKASTALSGIQWTVFSKGLFMLLEWGCYIAAIVLSCISFASRTDYLIFFLFMVGVTITYSNISFDAYIFRSKLFPWLGSFSYSLYLGHSCWREFTENIYPREWSFKQQLTCYLVLAVWNGLLIHYLSVFLRALRYKKVKALFVVPREDT